MKIKTTIICLILLIGLGVYVYFFESKPYQTDEAGNRIEFLLPDYKPDSITEFSIIFPDTTQNIQCTRNKDSTWRVSLPCKDQGDSDQINAFLKSFQEIKPNRIIKSNSGSLSGYGLDSPLVSFEIKESNSNRITIGTLSPGNNTYYVKKSGNAWIYLIYKNNVESWFKTSFDFRDKNILDLSRDSLTDIQINYSKQKSIILEKKNNKWYSKDPVRLELDQVKLGLFLENIQKLQIKAIDDYPNPDLKKYNLTSPEVRIMMKNIRGENSQLDFSISKPDSDLIYARSSLRPGIFSLDTSILNSLMIKDVNTLLNKSIFNMDIDDIVMIQWIKPKSVLINKTNDIWYNGQTKLEYTNVTDYLYSLNDIQFNDMIDTTIEHADKYGFKDSDYSLKIKDLNGNEQRLELVKNQKNRNYLLGKSSSQSCIFSLNQSLINLLFPDIQTFIKKPSK